MRLLDFLKLRGQIVQGEKTRLARLGFISKYSAGYYNILPLGMLLMKKIQAIVEQELQNIQAVEVAVPLVSKLKHWNVSGRDNIYSKEFIRLEGNQHILPPTSEEDMSMLLNYPCSKSQFPLLYYQTQWKFRNELRCRNELLRTRQFLMNDCYSFDLTEDASRVTYEQISKAYSAIFKKLELPCITIEADSKDMKGLMSHEYLVAHPEGDSIIYKSNDKYSFNGTTNKTNAIEAAHTFLLGDYYTKKFSRPINNAYLIMGCYGIGITRLMSICSMYHKYFPKSISPLSFVIIDINNQVDSALDTIVQHYGDQKCEIAIYTNPKNVESAIKDVHECGIDNVYILGKDYKNSNLIEHRQASTKSKLFF